MPQPEQGEDGRVPDEEPGRADDENRSVRSSDADHDLTARMERLSRSLKEEDRQREEREKSKSGDSAGFGLALRLASEFVAGILVGAALGWGLDKLAGTSPWGLIVFLMLGFVAGVFNVLRSSGEMSPTGVKLVNKEKGPNGPDNSG